jgi:chemotaxis methyl-accepting protein methylase
MSKLLLRPISYRHVVFPDRNVRHTCAVNFGCADERPSDESAPDEQLSADEYHWVRFLFQEAGLNIDDYRFETIKRRIPACLRAVHLESLSAVKAAVLRRPELLKAVIGSLVIGVTSFFRDPPVFDALAEKIIPRLLSQKNGPRLWSVGCSDGSELYSVAMLLAERGGLQRSTLLGTDCRADAVTRAREGSYDHAAVRHVPQPLLARYFQTEGATWRVHPCLRAISQWRFGNALTTAEPGAWDLILCRNMSIYMQPPAAMRLWKLLESCLRPGGYLVLGKAERPTGANLAAFASCIFRRDRS